MITNEQAEQIATQVVGALASDPENGWDLVEFDAGWLIQVKATMNLRGAGCRVVEHESGRVMFFPYYVPSGRILEEYDQVVADGVPEYFHPATLREDSSDLITRDQAKQIAAQLVGAPASDPDNGWDLLEFDAGWLILEHATINIRGAGSRVVERKSGRVLHFPSYVPPGRILEEYDQVVADGFPEDLPPATLRERQQPHDHQGPGRAHRRGSRRRARQRLR